MYAFIHLLATYVVFIPIVVAPEPEPPTAFMYVERYEQEADIWLGREANQLKLSVSSDGMQLSGCFVGEICEEGSRYIGPEDHMSRWCMLTDHDYPSPNGHYVMKCAYPEPEATPHYPSVWNMTPHWTRWEDGSFTLYARMPFEVDPQ